MDSTILMISYFNYMKKIKNKKLSSEEKSIFKKVVFKEDKNIIYKANDDSENIYPNKHPLLI